MGSPRHGNGKARSGQDIEAQEILNQPSGNFGFGRRCRRDLRVGFADDTVAAVALGRVEAAIGARDQGLHGVAFARRCAPERDRDPAEPVADAGQAFGLGGGRADRGVHHRHDLLISSITREPTLSILSLKRVGEM